MHFWTYWSFNLHLSFPFFFNKIKYIWREQMCMDFVSENTIHIPYVPDYHIQTTKKIFQFRNIIAKKNSSLSIYSCTWKQRSVLNYVVKVHRAEKKSVLKIWFWKYDFENMVLKIWFWKYGFENSFWKHDFENMILKTWFWKHDFEDMILKTWFWKHDFEDMILKHFFENMFLRVFQKMVWKSSFENILLKTWLENMLLQVWFWKHGFKIWFANMILKTCFWKHDYETKLWKTWFLKTC